MNEERWALAARLEQAAERVAEHTTPTEPVDPWTFSRPWSLAREGKERTQVGPEGQGQLCRRCAGAWMDLIAGLETHEPEEERTRLLMTACIGQEGAARCHACLRLLIHSLSDEEVDLESQDWMERKSREITADESYGLVLILNEWSERLRLVEKVDMELAGKMADAVDRLIGEPAEAT